MNKQELIDLVSREALETKKATESIVNALSKVITDELKSGGEVTLPGIGKLSVATRAEKAGRNPKTGDPLTIPASVAPKFKASKTLKDALN